MSRKSVYLCDTCSDVFEEYELYQIVIVPLGPNGKHVCPDCLGKLTRMLDICCISYEIVSLPIPQEGRPGSIAVDPNGVMDVVRG